MQLYREEIDAKIAILKWQIKTADKEIKKGDNKMSDCQCCEDCKLLKEAIVKYEKLLKQKNDEIEKLTADSSPTKR